MDDTKVVEYNGLYYDFFKLAGGQTGITVTENDPAKEPEEGYTEIWSDFHVHKDIVKRTIIIKHV